MTEEERTIGFPTDPEEQTATETPAEKFSRIATKRFHNAIHHMRLIQNCAGAGYAYTPEQVTTIVTALQKEVDAIENVFAGKTKDEELPSL